METWVDFKEVKSAVSVELVLERYQVELRRVNAHTLRGHCPLPTHDERSKGSSGSFSANTLKNVWACQSTGCVQARGRKGGNVLDLVVWMERCSVREAALKLQGWFLEGKESKARPETEKAPAGVAAPAGAKEVEKAKCQTASASDDQDNGTPATGKEGNKPLGFTLKLNLEHPCFKRRGLHQETVEHFGIGFCERGSMRNRIAIPIHDEKGQLLAYAGRWVGADSELPEGEGKYKLPPSFHKSHVLFNLHRVPKEAKTVIAVEGFFSVFWLWQAGFENVVALMGSSLSEHQLVLLATRFKGVRFFMDGDKAGREAEERCAAAAAKRLWVRIVECPQGRQPDGISPDDVRHRLGEREGNHG